MKTGGTGRDIAWIPSKGGLYRAPRVDGGPPEPSTEPGAMDDNDAKPVPMQNELEPVRLEEQAEDLHFSIAPNYILCLGSILVLCRMIAEAYLCCAVKRVAKFCIPSGGAALRCFLGRALSQTSASKPLAYG